MKIKYNEIDRLIEIKDGLKTHSFVIKFLMVLNLLNAVLSIFIINKNGIGFQSAIWFVLGLVSLIVLYLFVFKKTTLEKIPIKDIKGLSEKSIFGKSRFSIQLVNGKKRELPELKTQAEFDKLKKMFADFGIAE